MKGFKTFLQELNLPTIIMEQLHNDIKSILDSQDIPVHHKLNMITKKIRELHGSGQNSGLNDEYGTPAAPKKGSSRAVFFPHEHDDITIDGEKAKIPSVVKVAYRSTLENKALHRGTLLGEMQNQFESDGYNHQHSVLEHQGGDNYTYHPHGVLAPILDKHEDDHWLKMGRISPMKKSDFTRLTKTDTHQKGLKFDDVRKSLNHEYHASHGNGFMYDKPDNHGENMEHPWVENYHSWMLNTGAHPGDMDPRNMGVWKHPITGKEHVVSADYGFSTDIGKQYAKLRKQSAY